MKRTVSIVILILISIATTLLSTIYSYRNALRAADDFLESQALGIASSLDSAVSRHGTRENIFSDIIGAEKWEGIAFLALYREDGVTVLHSNENLIGKKADDPEIVRVFASGKTVSGYKMLGTGEEIYMMDNPLYLKDSAMVLRVALHTYPARAIVREAKFQMLSVLVIIAVLAGMSACLLLLLRKRQALERALIEREKLSLIGEMSSVLAHEIRNPLGSIKGFAQYLREQIATGKPGPVDEALQSVDVIIAESQRIEALTDDLLIYARHEALNVSPFDLSSLIKGVVASVHMPEGASVHADLPPSLSVVTDSGKLRHVMVNLLQNAADALQGGGTVRITLRELKDVVTLEVADTGTGMDNKTMAQLFKPFFTTKTQGTGIGLALVERYMKLLSGTIEVDSEPGKGSVFTVRIPKMLEVPEGK